MTSKINRHSDTTLALSREYRTWRDYFPYAGVSAELTPKDSALFPPMLSKELKGVVYWEGSAKDGHWKVNL